MCPAVSVNTSRLARVLDPAELGRNFGGGAQWQTARWDGLDFVGSTRFYEVELRAQDPLWHLRVEAVDDPSDSEEVTASDPVGALADFLARGLPGGGDFFRDRAAALRRMAAALRSSAPPTPRAVARAVFALVAKADDLGLGDTEEVPTRRRGPSSGPSSGPAQGPDETSLVGGLLRKMRQKGWDVSQGETDWGAPLLKVGIGDEYRAEVRVDSMPFSYRFGFKGRPDVSSEGVTDDPIREFKSWYRSPEVEEAWEEANAAPPPSEAPTAAPPRRP